MDQEQPARELSINDLEDEIPTKFPLAWDFVEQDYTFTSVAEKKS